jgi:hypothetical protein
MEIIKFSLKHLAYLSLLVVLSSFTFVNSNTLKNQTFGVNGNAFEKIERNSYTFTYLEDFSNPYGNFIDFTDSIFHSYYRAPCGNDCFTDVKGTYNFLTDSTVQFFITSITKKGKCMMNKDYTKGNFGVYIIQKKINSITLIK